MEKSFPLLLAAGAAAAFVAAWQSTAPPRAGGPTGVRVASDAGAGAAPERSRIEASVYYSGCNAARAAGAAPIYAGQPGYRPEMDGDGDGIACEPRRR
ncbi:MAG TPA: excalibur calcium-binding domain-containing protein [Allosphingosinicella sp.]